MKALIIEDNISTSWDYEIILNKLNIQVQGVFKSWKLALQEIKSNPPGFIILDLFLEKNEIGLDLLEEIKKLFIPVIICSGYPEDEYHEAALKSDVYAFLSKPIDKPSLVYQIKKLTKDIKEKNIKTDFLVVKEKRNLIRVPFQQIQKIEIEGNYSYVYLSSGKKYVIKISLVKLVEELDPLKFIRCFRSTLVNLDYIQSVNVNESRILMKDGSTLTLGLKYKASVKKAYLS